MSYIYFKVNVETKYFQTAKICGNLPELGDWNPKFALKLETNDFQYPRWTHEQKIQIPSGNPFYNVGTQLEFKCILTNDDVVEWEQLGNRSLWITKLRNYITFSYGNAEIELRNYITPDGSQCLDQEELNKVQRLEDSRKFEPFEQRMDSSDNENDSVGSNSEYFNNMTSIKQLEIDDQIDWKELIEVFMECHQCYFQKKDNKPFVPNFCLSGSQDQIFDKMRKRSQCNSMTQINAEQQHVICLCFKIPIKITIINNNHQVLTKEDLLLKYDFKITTDPYYASQFDLFTNRLKLPVVWIGWLGIDIQDLVEIELLQQYLFMEWHCYGVNIDGKKYIDHCLQLYLEPIFQNLLPQRNYDIDYMDHYQELNLIFSKIILDSINGTLFSKYGFCNQLHSIFNYDYHFLLIPYLIKDRLISMNEFRPRLCQIINKQFPNHNNFKIIENNHIVIHSLLINDLISFVDIRDLEQFTQCLPLEFQKLSKINGMSAYNLEVQGRQIILDYDNMGLNHKKYDESLINKELFPDTKYDSQEIILLSVDRVSVYSGLEQKFKIMEVLHKLQNKIKLIQVIYVTNEAEFTNNWEAQKYYEKLLELANTINNGEQFIELRLDLNHTEILQLCKKASGYLKTCLRENISLNYLEYIYVRQFFNSQAKLILSIWCTPKVAHIKINPIEIEKSAYLIYKYLSQESCIHINVPNSNEWLSRLNEHLNQCEDLWMERYLYSNSEYIIGSKDKTFHNIMPTKVIQKYVSSQPHHQRVFIIDFCLEFRRKLKRVDQFVQQLECLANNKQNTIILISDLHPKLLELTIRNVYGMFIITQDGQYIKQNGYQNEFYRISRDDEIIYYQIEQIGLQRQYKIGYENNIYSLTPEQKYHQGSLAANIQQQSIIKQLKAELNGYSIEVNNNQIVVKHKYQRIEDLIRIICAKEYKIKGYISFAVIISNAENVHKQMNELFNDNIDILPRVNKFHYFGISNEMNQFCNLVIQNSTDLIQFLQRFHQESENIILNTLSIVD